jgi:ATP-dependent Clp protease ATP-binding subunit ClpC
MPTATPRVVKALKRSEEVAAEFGHEHVGTEHLMVGLLADPHGVATQVVAKHADVGAVIAELRRLLGSPSYNRPVAETKESNRNLQVAPLPKLTINFPGQ